MIATYLESEGARLAEPNVYVLDTPVGEWEFSVYPDWTATRFACPAVARRVVECNPYSGKFNFHGDANTVENIGHYVGRIVCYQPTEEDREAIAAERASSAAYHEYWEDWQQVYRAAKSDGLWYVVLQDHQALQPDGTWGRLKTARRFATEAEAQQHGTPFKVL